MMGARSSRRLLAIGCSVAVTATGCAFNGLNSIPLPGVVGRGPDSTTYHVEIANVGTLESNSPVMVDDVVVGSVGKMTVRDWHADVEVFVKPGVVIPANAVASVGQTSLLGSMHMALAPPVGEAPQGSLRPNATIPLDKSSTYPSTEKTLASLSAVVNAGGLGQLGDVIHNFNAALSGREGEVRDLLTRLDTFVGTLDGQRDNIIAAIDGINRLSATFAQQRDVIARALQKVPPALEVLLRERPRITTALEKLGAFSKTATGLINDTQADLVRNLQNLEPTLRALADIGPDLDLALAYAPTAPLGQNTIDRAVRGDYMNLYSTFDLTVPRLKRTLFLGTRWGKEGATIVAAPGDPYNLNYTYDPLNVSVSPPAPDAAPPAEVTAPPAGAAPSGGVPVPLGPSGDAVLPLTPPPAPDAAPPQRQIFAGPYPPADQGGQRTDAAPTPGAG